MEIYLNSDTMQRRNIIIMIMCFSIFYEEENHSELTFEQSLKLFKEQIHEFMVRTAKLALVQNIELKTFPAQLILEWNHELHSSK